MTTQAPDKFLTIRVTAELHDRLAALAERNQRTISGEVRVAIIDRLEHQKA